eukprot:8877808-Alexandrium_andersonii.AAC.1
MERPKNTGALCSEGFRGVQPRDAGLLTHGSCMPPCHWRLEVEACVHARGDGAVASDRELDLDTTQLGNQIGQ